MGASLPGHDLAGNQIACRLVGDELAHDLDIETLERLESLPVDCQGTVLLVSRDRARLNDVATGTLVIEDDGLVKEQQASHDGDLRQRPAEPACQSGPDPDDPGSKAADVSREQSRKLSVNERLEPDSMPGRIEELEKTAQDRWRRAGRTVVPPPRSCRDRRRGDPPGRPGARPGRCLRALARPARACWLTGLAR